MPEISSPLTPSHRPLEKATLRIERQPNFEEKNPANLVQHTMRQNQIYKDLDKVIHRDLIYRVPSDLIPMMQKTAVHENLLPKDFMIESKVQLYQKSKFSVNSQCSDNYSKILGT